MASPPDKALQDLIDKQRVRLGGIYRELTTAGRKTSHWIWWVFPTELAGASEAPPPTFVTLRTAPHLLRHYAHASANPWRTVLEWIVDHCHGHPLGLQAVFSDERDRARIGFFVKFWGSVVESLEGSPEPAPRWFKNVLDMLRDCVKRPKQASDDLRFLMDVGGMTDRIQARALLYEKGGIQEALEHLLQPTVAAAPAAAAAAPAAAAHLPTRRVAHRRLSHALTAGESTEQEKVDALLATGATTDRDTALAALLAFGGDVNAAANSLLRGGRKRRRRRTYRRRRCGIIATRRG